MFISRKKLSHSDREDLIRIIDTLSEKIRKKNEDLARVRGKLKQTKSRLLKMQTVISYQRKRIVELYSAGDNLNMSSNK
jgi:hypothetical protein